MKVAQVFDPRDRSDERDFPLGFQGGKWTYHKPWSGARIRFMARSGGYVMVRKSRAMPFVIDEKMWASLPLWKADPNA